MTQKQPHHQSPISLVTNRPLRSKTITFWCTRHEQARWKIQASYKGMSLSAYIRHLLDMDRISVMAISKEAEQEVQEKLLEGRADHQEELEK